MDHSYIRAQITKLVDRTSYPDIVECRFIDRFGHEWVVIDKLPVVTDAHLGSDSVFPQPAVIACKIVSRSSDASGRDIVEVELGPEMESQDGVTRFEVFADQLTKAPWSL